MRFAIREDLVKRKRLASFENLLYPGRAFFARYMNDPEFKELAAKWLGQQVYANIPKNISCSKIKKG